MGERLVEHYEALRAWAQGRPTARSTPKGLDLFLRRGLPSWLRTWAQLLAAETVALSPPIRTATRPPGRVAAAEVVVVLTSMVLGNREGKRA